MPHIEIKIFFLLQKHWSLFSTCTVSNKAGRQYKQKKMSAALQTIKKFFHLTVISLLKLKVGVIDPAGRKNARIRILICNNTF
jgi:hypothetical protein